jgi:hypothetical protein
MAKVRTVFSTVVGGWEQLLTALLANTQQFLHLEEQRNRLQQLLERARQLATEQDLHTAAKQEASKELKVILADGKKLATFLRNGVKERFGNRSEKLVEFGVQALPPPPPGDRRHRGAGDQGDPGSRQADRRLIPSRGACHPHAPPFFSRTMQDFATSRRCGGGAAL